MVPSNGRCDARVQDNELCAARRRLWARVQTVLPKARALCKPLGRVKTRRTALVFASGCAVYALMASCGGSVSTTASGTASGASTSSGSSGNAASTGSGEAASSSAASSGHGGSGGAGGKGMGGAAGHGGAGGTTNQTTSGTRLKRMLNVGDDGTTDLTLVFQTWASGLPPNSPSKPTTLWWDSQRKEACFFQLAADGKTRCFPSPDATLIVYVDPACSKKAVGVPAAHQGCSQSVPPYAFSADPQVCPVPSGVAPLHVFSVGNFLGVQSNFFSGPSCSQGFVNPPLAFYEVGLEVAPTSFVAATPAQDP